MTAFDEAPILNLAGNAIAGEAACGADAADDPQYIAVVSELDKLDRIESEGPDWYQLEQDAITLLSSKSKDIVVACALGYALFQRHSYAGLGATLGLLTGLVKNFWDGLHPPRPRRRKARIEALTNRFVEGHWFREHQPKDGEFDAIDQSIARIDELGTVLTGKMPDDPPDFKKFTAGLKELASRRPKPKQDEAASSAAAGSSPLQRLMFLTFGGRSTR